MALKCGSEAYWDSTKCKLSNSGRDVNLLKILHPRGTIDMQRLYGSTGEIDYPLNAEGNDKKIIVLVKRSCFFFNCLFEYVDFLSISLLPLSNSINFLARRWCLFPVICL